MPFQKVLAQRKSKKEKKIALALDCYRRKKWNRFRFALRKNVDQRTDFT